MKLVRHQVAFDSPSPGRTASTLVHETNTNIFSCWFVCFVDRFRLLEIGGFTAHLTIVGINSLH